MLVCEAKGYWLTLPLEKGFHLKASSQVSSDRPDRAQTADGDGMLSLSESEDQQLVLRLACTTNSGHLSTCQNQDFINTVQKKLSNNKIQAAFHWMGVCLSVCAALLDL